ncbi:MAG: glycoside hydrolase family 1 [Planctomycetota bacterium]|nr:glycoside hydrolase family 1 [Planctomycetota bacterium]
MPGSGWGTSAAEFRWAVGIENTFVPHTRAGHRRLDEYELMDHYRLWRHDLDKAADLGISTIRYGIPWYKVNPRPGVFDWSWTDDVLEHLVVTRDLNPIIDLMHYGTPLWLDNHFLNASYPRRVAEYAARFAERYGSIVQCYTPLNEPAVTASFCGRDGRWPPYLSGDDGYVKILLALAEGINLTAEALRAIRPDTILVHVEDVGLEFASTPALTAVAVESQINRLLPLDLACGKVGPDHPRYSWLIEHGASDGQLQSIARTSPSWDVLGVNFYPWTNRRIVSRQEGRPRTVRDSPPSALADVLRMVHARYNLPLMVTETSSPGTHLERARWMRETLAAVRQVRADGLPVVGYTWFPMFTMIEWKYRWSRKGLEHHLLHLGLFDVPVHEGRMDREPTPLVEAFRQHLSDPACSIGEWPVPVPTELVA